MSIWIIELILIWIFNFLCFHTTFGKPLNKKKLFLFLSLTVMALVLGLRSNHVGEDTAHYVNIFNKSSEIRWSQIFTEFRIVWRSEGSFLDRIENGFLFLAKITQLLTDNPQFFLMVIATLTMVCFGKFIYDNSKNVFFSTYVLMCECLYMSSFNGARQILAVSVGINAFTLLKKKNVQGVLGAIVVIILAALIHNTALIFFLMIPFMLLKSQNMSKTYKRFKYVFIGCALIPFLLPAVNLFFSYVLPRYSKYFENNYWNVDIGGTAILWLIEIMLILMLYRNHFYEENSFELSALVLVYLLLEGISFQYSAFARVAWYYRGFLILFFPTAVRGFRKVKYGQITTYMLLTLLTLAFLSYARVDSRTYQFFLR